MAWEGGAGLCGHLAEGLEQLGVGLISSEVDEVLAARVAEGGVLLGAQAAREGREGSVSLARVVQA